MEIWKISSGCQKCLKKVPFVGVVIVEGDCGEPMGKALGEAMFVPLPLQATIITSSWGS